MKPVKLGERDLHLLAVLAEARCLSTEQVRRLFFRGSDASLLGRRLRKLSGSARALVKRVEWYDRSGAKTAWALTPAGYAEAEALIEQELDVPRDDIGAEYLDHHVLLSELYVGLLAADVDAQLARVGRTAKRQELGRVFARARHPDFRWVVVGDRELPWKQAVGAKLEARLLRPDAFLELPGQRRRVFVESEMGTHTIAAASASKTGATTAKMERYEAFCSLVSGPSKRSWYAERFADGWKPEVLFLVRSKVREGSVQRAVDAWRRAHAHAVCGFRVATVETALAELLPVLGKAAPAVPAAKGGSLQTQPAPREPVLSLEEVKALRSFFAAVSAEWKRRRDAARAANHPVPEYPPGTKDVHALYERLKHLG